MHATWNAILKSDSSDRLATFGVIMTTGTVMGLCVVPFVPISGTPLESHPAPSSAFMASILQPLSQMTVAGGMQASDIKAGCGKCGACSALSTYEKLRLA